MINVTDLLWLQYNRSEISGSTQNDGKIDLVEDHEDIECRIQGHVGGCVLIENCPFLHRGGIKHPDRLVVGYSILPRQRVPVLGYEYSGAWIVVGEGMVLGQVAPLTEKIAFHSPR